MQWKMAFNLLRSGIKFFCKAKNVNPMLIFLGQIQILEQDIVVCTQHIGNYSGKADRVVA